MADTDSERDVEMEELRAELARLREAIADRSQQLRDVVGERAAVVRDNPGTFASTFVLGGLVGLLIGAALSHAQPSRNRWLDW